MHVDENDRLRGAPWVRHGAQQTVVCGPATTDPIGAVVLGVHPPPEGVTLSRRSAGCCTAAHDTGKP